MTIKQHLNTENNKYVKTTDYKSNKHSKKTNNIQ